MTIWQIDETQFPTHGTFSEKVNFWLRYGVLAPSAHNTQPWRVELEGEKLKVYRDPAHMLQAGDPTLRETTLGIGAFIENIAVAADHWGYRASIDHLALTTEELLQAVLSFESTGQPGLPAGLFAGLTQRHTNRGHYDSQSLPDELLTELRSLPLEFGVTIFLLTDQSARSQVADLVRQGTHIGLSMRAMREELAELTHTVAEARPDGMLMEAMIENPPVQLSPKEWLLQHFDTTAESQYWGEAFALSPLHCIVATELDGPQAWLAAGRSMERLLLTAAAQGLTSSISAAPIEIPTLAPQLRQLIDSTYRPQVLFRLGRPTQPDFTYLTGRRPLMV